MRRLSRPLYSIISDSGSIHAMPQMLTNIYHAANAHKYIPCRKCSQIYIMPQMHTNIYHAANAHKYIPCRKCSQIYTMPQMLTNIYHAANAHKYIPCRKCSKIYNMPQMLTNIYHAANAHKYIPCRKCSQIHTGCIFIFVLDKITYLLKVGIYTNIVFTLNFLKMVLSRVRFSMHTLQYIHHTKTTCFIQLCAVYIDYWYRP
jgi:hypothetical protein